MWITLSGENYPVRRIVLIPVILMITGTMYLFSQNIDDRIDIYSINLKYLEFLTKVKIDSIRTANHLLPLYNDAICYLAAQDHAYYLMDTPDIGHMQENSPLKKTPQDRVEYYGGSDYRAGENIVKIYLLKPTTYIQGISKPQTVIITTYREAVDLMAEAWTNSAEHFVNIVTGTFRITGVSVLFNEEDYSLVCVQVFAAPGKDYTPNESKILFPYNQNDTNDVNSTESPERVLVSPYINKYDLKYPAPPKEKEEVKSFIKSFSNWSILYNGNKVYLKLDNIEKVRNFFDQPLDGFALEIVTLDKYNCSSDLYYNSPRRKNGESILEGHASKPVYRNQLLKISNSYFGSKNRSAFVPYIGTIPGRLQGPYELNILIIKNNYIAEVIYTNHLCSDFQDFTFRPPLLKKEIDTLFYSNINDLVPGTLAEDHNRPGNSIETLFIKKYNDLYRYFSEIYPVNNTDLQKKILHQLDSLQNFLFIRNLQHSIGIEPIDELPWLFSTVPGKPDKIQPLAILYYNRVMFKYFYLKDQISDAELFSELGSLMNFTNPNPELVYNYYALLIDNTGNGLPDFRTRGDLHELKNVLENIKSQIPSEYYDALNLFYNIGYVRKIAANQPVNEEIIRPSIYNIINYLKNHDASPEIRVLLARYLIHYRFDQEAYNVLLPVVNTVNIDREGYILHLKLYYSGKIMLDNSENYYKKIIEASDLLAPADWIGLFDGPCRLNMQLLDYEPLYTIYCNKMRQVHQNSSE